jgi:hypothetical protein
VMADGQVQIEQGHVRQCFAFLKILQEAGAPHG